MTLEQVNQEPATRICSNCGNETAAQDPICVHCGRTSIEADTEHKAAREHYFLRALFTRSNPFTLIFIGANVAIYVLMCLAGGIAITSVDSAVLIGFGAKQNDLIIEQHQYWRLITAMFIHIGFIHLFLNNYALWIIGQEIERIYGSARFVMLYLVTGVLGSLGSYYFNPHATSAGASGAIFGLFGVVATFAFRYRKEIPELLSREIKRRVLPIIAINLVFGFSVRIVDNAAHLSGLLSGAALALVVPYKRPNEKITPLWWRALQIICLALILASFVGAFRSYDGPRLSLSNLTTRPGSTVVAYFDRMKVANRSLSDSINSFADAGENKSVEANLAKARDSADQGIRAAAAAPRVDSDAEQYRKRLSQLLSEQKDIIEQSASKNRNDSRTEENKLRDNYKQFSLEYNKWLPEFLKEHGYELGEGRRD
jgi:rhomboid protease GluP